ncbi:hypothetical protein STXM2123_1552 [Streptomyces sp. F-3]|nr:hypothetical protein STXM2123_1552 [Streptomyces sp. F-3]
MRGRADSGACPVDRSVCAYGVLFRCDIHHAVRFGGLPKESLSRTGTRSTSPWWGRVLT